LLIPFVLWDRGGKFFILFTIEGLNFGIMQIGDLYDGGRPEECAGGMGTLAHPVIY
jgi:hypothetical protein